MVYYEGKPVFESMLVANFFEELYPNQGTSLLPKDAAGRALVHFIYPRFQVGPFYGLLTEQDKTVQEEKKEKLREALKKFNDDLHQFVPNPSGPYLCGEFSLADVAVFPFIDRFVATLKHYRDFDLNISEYDRINAAWEAVKARPAFQKASCPPEFYIKAYDRYANPK